MNYNNNNIQNHVMVLAFGVAWRHRSCDHSIGNKYFYDIPSKSSRYLSQLFRC